ncbi:MAG: hypothetical protein WD737_13070 [Gemmatimonadota bacterium]
MMDYDIASLRADDQVTATLRIVFRRVPVGERGFLAKTKLFAGCTGASFFLNSNPSQIINYTRGSTIPVNYTISEDSGATSTIEPQIKGKLEGGGAVDIKFFTLSRALKESGTADFGYSEQVLAAAKELNDRAVRWEFDLPAGPKVVRFGAVGNMELVASIADVGKGVHHFAATGQPSNRCLFDSFREPLGRRGSLALWMKLRAKGANLPSFKPIERGARI